MKKYWFVCLLGIFLILASGVVLASPPKDTLTTTATQSANGSKPTVNGEGNAANWVYAYTLSCNSTLSDTLHVELVISNTNNSTIPESYNIGFSAQGDSEIHATLPASFSLTDNGITMTKDIPITTDTLAPGDYALNIHIDTPPNALVEPDAKNIKVMIHVNECTASVPTCFFTDSNGEFLSDCSGVSVSTNAGGTFMLVNKKNGVIVATNPGQFYYNYIWSNNGPAVDAQVQLGDLLNLAPQGANAVHAYTFDTSGFTQDIDSFDMVNNDGTPCGPSGPCTVNVGEGQTLWVTWHLAYSGIGSVKSTAGYSCPGSEQIGAAAELVDADNTTSQVASKCTASATGYNKK